jgi:hypothetical protein
MDGFLRSVGGMSVLHRELNIGLIYGGFIIHIGSHCEVLDVMYVLSGTEPTVPAASCIAS